MKKLNKLIAVLFAIIAIFTLVGCGSSDEQSGESDDETTTTPSEEILSLAETTAILDASPYTSSELNGLYGLSSPTDVGVVESSIDEILVEIPADSEFASAELLVFENASGTTDSEKMDSIMTSANALIANNQKVKITLPNRTIDISQSEMTSRTDSNYMIAFSDFTELYIEGGEDTVLMIEIADAWLGAITVSNGEKVAIKNVKVDYKYASVFTGVIESSDDDALTMTMNVPESQNEQFTFAKANSSLYNTLYSMVEYNRYTDAPQEGGKILIKDEGYFEKVEFIEGDTNQIKVTFSSIYKDSYTTSSVNNKVALGFTMYGNHALGFSTIDTVEVEDFTVYAVPGMAIHVSSCGDVLFNRSNFELNGDRLMTATADGYHILACTGEVKIVNSVLENTHDDALNIKSGYYYSFSSYDSTTRTINISRLTESIDAPQAGDILNVYKSETFELIAELTVASASGSGASYSIVVEERLSGYDFDNCVVTNISDSATLVFKNNIIQNKRNRGILVQVQGAEITNNYFTNVAHGAISIHSSLDTFNEATIPKNVVVKDNKLINNGYGLSLRGDISVFAIGSTGVVAPSGTIQDITIENNYIKNSGNAGVSLRGVGGETSSINNNLFYNVARVYNSELTNGCVELVNVTDINIIGNYNQYTLDDEYHCGIIPSGVTDTSTLVVEDNFNFAYQNLSGDVATTTVTKVSDSDITLDGSITDWANIGEDIDMVGHSLATGDSILPSTYKDVFEVLETKITWTDSGIYLAYSVFDDTLNFASKASFWTGDLVEIFVTNYLDMPNADFSAVTEEGEMAQLAAGPYYDNMLVCGDSRTTSYIVSGLSSIKSVMEITSTGYTGEIFLPFSLFTGFKESIDAGENIALCIVFADADRDDIGRTRLQVSNVEHFVETYKTRTAKTPLFNFV